MPDTIYESDSEFEEYLRTCGSIHFGSSLTNSNETQETRTCDSSRFGSSRFGSSPSGCHLSPEKTDAEREAGAHFGCKREVDDKGAKPAGAHFGCKRDLVKNVEKKKEDKERAESSCEFRFGSGSSHHGCHLISEKGEDLKDNPLNLLEHKAKEIENEINAIEEGWEQMSILVDSGSTETVAPESALAGYELKSTDWSESGKGYSAANGTDIPNLGEKVVRAQTESGMWCTMRFQICSVTKPLGSVSRICQAGSRVVFQPPEEGSYIQNVTTGKKTMLRQSKGLYYLDVWIAPATTFPRQGRNM